MAKKASKSSQKNSIKDTPKTKFTLYNYAGQEKSYYLVDRINLERPDDISKKSVAHSIIIIDRSGSMYYDIQALKETLIKLLTLDEYSNLQLVITLISYSSKGDVTSHFQRVPIQEVMKNNSPYIQEIKRIQAGCLTCISQAMQLAKSLIQAGEMTAITLHSDGYANDSSPSSEAKALEEICGQLKSMDVFVNTIAYSYASDFKLLSKIANTVSGFCIKAGDVKEVYDTIYSTSKLLGCSVAPAMEETLGADYTYQIFLSKSAKKINGTSGTLKIFGLRPEDEIIIYKYKRISKEVYEQLTDVPVVQNHESVYAFAKANLAEGNLNTAKYAIASTFDTTLTERHAKALTNAQIADFAQDIDIALFYPTVLREHEIGDRVKVNDKISLLELIKILEQHRSSIIINIKHLQENYQRKGIKKIKGSRDENGNLVKPWLTTEYTDNCDYVGMGSFDINRNTATINMLITRKTKLIKIEDKTPIIEVAGLLVNELVTFNNYTVVSDGELNIKSLQVKISSKKAFDLLKEKGVLELNVPVEKFDFRAEYTIKLDNLPLVPFDAHYSSIDGLFYQLAEIKVLSSIISAHLKEESDVFLPEQLSELKNHYLSKSLYLNFPTTNEYTDIKEALANGTVDSRVSYKIDIGSKDILNLGKLHTANKFLDRMYQVYDTETGEIFEKPSFDIALNPNIAFRHKQISSRTKITKVDDFMKPIFDDFLGLEDNGIITAILSTVGADNLVRVLEDKWNNQFTKEEMVTALTAANIKLDEYAEKIYRDKICPLVFYIGSTGLLPDEMEATSVTADELAAKYGNLQFSRDEQEGTFFVVGNSIISVYAKNEYYSIKPAVGVED